MHVTLFQWDAHCHPFDDRYIVAPTNEEINKDFRTFVVYSQDISGPTNQQRQIDWNGANFDNAPLSPGYNMSLICDGSLTRISGVSFPSQSHWFNLPDESFFERGAARKLLPDFTSMKLILS